MVKMTEPKIFTRGKILWIRFSLNGENIRRSLKLEDTKENRKLVKTQIIPQMVLKAHTGKFFENITVPTVSQMIEKSLSMHKANRKEITHTTYSAVLNKHVVPVFGNKKINSIKPSDLIEWQNNLLTIMSSQSAITTRIIFHGIFEDALRDEIINKNPFSIIKAPKTSKLKPIEPFSKDEIFRILDSIPDRIKLYFAIGFFSGMRTGEITALRYSDIDLKNKTIRVNKTRSYGKDTSPKTTSSCREVDILDVLLPYLQKHIENYKQSDDQYLFLNKFDNPYTTSAGIKLGYWKPTLEKLNIKYRTMYQMRHTFASQMISNNEDILWVSNMLGHKDSNITLQVYAKYMKKETKKRGSFLLAS